VIEPLDADCVALDATIRVSIVPSRVFTAGAGIGVLKNLRHQDRTTGVCNQASSNLTKYPSNAKFCGNSCHVALTQSGVALPYQVLD
jgi:hypothetical protein